MSEEQKEMQVEAAEKAAKKVAPVTTAEPEENFDWDAYENDAVVPASEKDALTQKYAETLSKVGEKEVVEGTVISMNKREVVVNIGYKSDGIISLNEFRYNPELKVGDKVEVYVETQEDKKGQLTLSHKQARALRSWDRVNEALEKDEIIKGFVKCRTKGGMIVDVFGIEAFLPGSQIDVKPIRDYDVYVGKTMEFKVVKINQEFKNVVVSHKALIEAELEQQKKEIIGKLNRTVVRYTQATEEKVKEADCLLIDCFGLLSSIYRYGEIAYIGGGFGVGIHNVLEAAVYGMPVIFGPNNKRFREAQGLLQCKGGFEIQGAEDFKKIMDEFLTNYETLDKAGKKAGNYVRDNAGALEKIMHTVTL